MLDLSVIIPFKDKASMTIDCLDSLHQYGGNIKEILLLSNRSSSEELKRVQQAASKYSNTRVLEYDHPFNFQKINNWGVGQSGGKVVMLLNNDIELTEHSKGLLEAMYQKALLPDVGTVGCVLLYEDRKTIQHAGVYLVPGGTADHLYTGKSLSRVLRSEKTYNIRNDFQVTAVTAAAVMIERTKFDKVGGMNENFIICGGDVDLSMRCEDKGYASWVIGANSGHMLHKESKSRSMLAVPYVDFVESYKVYVKHFDIVSGDRYLSWNRVKNV